MPPQDVYLESEVLSADPVELVRLLYRGTGDAVRAAMAHMAAGRIRERCHQINKAHAILTHLSCTLDQVRGGALSAKLAELYDYMQRRLIEANLQQKPESLGEVERLLSTLQKGWDHIAANQAVSPREGRISPAEELFPAAEYAAVCASSAFTEYAPQSWSF